MKKVSAEIKAILLLDDARVPPSTVESSEGFWTEVEQPVKRSKAKIFLSAGLLQVFIEQVLPAQLHTSSKYCSS